jgi:hypothetical protein
MTSTFWLTKDDINFLENGKRPQYLENGRRPKCFGKIEDNLNFLGKLKTTGI